MHAEKKQDAKAEKSGEEVRDDAPDPSSPCVITELDVTNAEEKEETEPGKQTRHGDDYLSGRSESDDCEGVDDDSLVFFYESDPCVTEDEPHYITTHEIQLSELSDHEGPAGVGSSSWDVEGDSQVYTFVDYSFEGDGAAVGERRDGSQHRALGEAAVSTLLENDLGDLAEFASSDESKHNGGEQIHLSIRTTSRAINDPCKIQEQENIFYHARRAGDVSHCVFRGVDGKAETLCDRAKCFIAAPGRLHLGGRLRGKEVTEYSSGTSSAVSELDDADKEVRNLTARAFKSLAYPYFDAINFSTSSESSASERGVGINRWSTFVDLKYGNVNMSQGLDQSVVSCQNATASFEIARNIENKGYRGIAPASAKPPTSKIFTLTGNPHGASKKIQLVGKFGQGQGGVIRLTETLNFRCNVNTGVSDAERRTKFAQNAAGSRSTDEVTNSLLSSQGRGASNSPFKTMEDAHKKAVFASSLIKNVISKKIQFEQERRMERGEIREPHQTASPSLAQQEGDSSHRWRGSSRELQRQTSRFSESSSDLAITCLEELGDVVDSGSCDSRRQDRAAPAAGTNLEPENEAGNDTKKGALEASRSTLLHSQNSAFRCWKDEELRFQNDHKNDETPEDEVSPAEDKETKRDQKTAGCRGRTRMSHLFVPTFLQSGDSSGSGVKGSSDNSLHVTSSRSLTTSKSPEIKINLRSSRCTKARAANASSSTVSLIRTDQALAAALKGESSDKAPHFMVRDVRDSKGKLQAPIHQVRDVRKLVKSSYHFVSLDNNENKSGFVSADGQKKQSHKCNPSSVSPIVIKCQSVNTNNAAAHPDLTTDESREDRPVAGPLSSSEEGSGRRVESELASKKQEKESETTEKKLESKTPNLAALEKLQAAVKTMEQLYVFDKNEWKRKVEAQPLSDSHVLSLIASEELEGSEETTGGFNEDNVVRGDSNPDTDKTPPTSAGSPGTNILLGREDGELPRVLQTSSSHCERPVTKSGRKISSKPEASTAARPNTATTQAAFSIKGSSKSSKKPVSNPNPNRSGVNRNRATESGQEEGFERPFLSASSENEYYLAIPVKSNAKTALSADETSSTVTAQPPKQEGSSSRGPEDHNQQIRRSSIVMETHSQEIPSAAVYHSLPLGVPASQQQVYCFSPAMTPAPTLDPFQATQRKMLLDPTTGNYYLVDTPVLPATKRLFDPETGQYVDVPMPHPPMTPVPMPISPLTLSPAAYGHTYMIYPGFMSTPSVIPAQTLVQSQMSVPLGEEGEENASSQHTEGLYMESPFYMATRKSPRAAVQQQAATNRPQHGFSSVTQPVISITSQQGSRLIAPPMFDGTTMSFVVEHR
ncbi:uncharacterized protein C4orf54 homolog [Nothobranchius furzeri]|uniref:Transcript variant X1 n=2 Tax=Nothobranchius furzeri TaxID=105023 RepID=A0A8C6P2R3_NOTFU|nr:uncharacterized protein C4orf54 homolog [Nothobranchius furzeri]XP_054589748.1 uncharacterized protein C4orf54 homolog [Nothobranchius furzeri]XP_054589749.1 uncharacterized protein C4orf54 homolog [Nothobranchius furzeri]KAF7207331.1 transcript variant X1 [Nothobranchius furzeri]